MIKVITDAYEEYTVVESEKHGILFEGHTIHPDDLIDIINIFMEKEVAVLERVAEEMESGDY